MRTASNAVTTCYSDQDAWLAALQIYTAAVQILGAVAYMHEQGIMHRDVKPENIMFAQSVETSRDNPQSDQVFNVKLIDLGMSARYDPKVPLRGRHLFLLASHCSMLQTGKQEYSYLHLVSMQCMDAKQG